MWTCPECSSVNADEMSLCTCGYDSNRPYAITDKPYAQKMIDGVEPKGMGGWLLFFCLMLAFNIVVAFYNYAIAAVHLSHLPSLTVVALPYILLGIPVSLFGAWTVFLLFSLRPSADFYVKLFLVLYAMASILVAILASSVEPQQMTQDVAIWYLTLKFRFGILLYCGIWFWYFSVSRRVHNTYRISN